MSERDKAALSKDAQNKLKERTDELIDSGEFAIDSDFIEEMYNETTSRTTAKAKFSSVHRKKLEDYLEECRLKREIADDFDL